MPFKHLKYILYIALAFFLSGTAKAQYIVNMTSGTTEINTIEHPVGIIYDDGGPNNNYRNSFSGTIRLIGTPGRPISVWGSYDTESTYDAIKIYTESSIPQATLSSVGIINTIVSNSGVIQITFQTDATVTRNGFEIFYASCADTTIVCDNQPSNLECSSITSSSAVISWHADNPSDTFLVTVNDATYRAYDTTFTVSGLAGSTVYSVRVATLADSASECCSTKGSFRTLCPNPPIVAYDNLYAPNVTCYYGTYTNPMQNIGVVDSGYLQPNSRHTIHYNSAETDPRTGGLLHCVPDGYCTSVRLGNWLVGSEAECITYTFTIDTTDHDLLIMKYASVMENPNHTAIDQPMFQFGIYDSLGNTINECYNATFISSNELGWNTGSSSNILWKDWTTVGVDLQPLHGQTITLKLATYDCDRSGHYGYAYYVLDLANKTLITESCSSGENTFRVPSGFNYVWYRLGQEDITLSTADTLHVTTGGFYQCRLSFVGAPASSSYSNCSFTMNAYAGERYPVAQFFATTDSVSCNERVVRLTNASFATIDPEHTHIIQNCCESYLWKFDDSTISTETNPTHTFTPGLHSVTLYAMLAGGECTDSLTLIVNAGNYCHSYDTTHVTICDNDSTLFYDSVYRTAGIYSTQDTTPTTLMVNIHTLVLNINPTIYYNTYDTIVQNQLPHTFHSITFSSSADTSMLWTATRPACDTIVDYHLKVWPNIYDTIRHYICQSAVPYYVGGFTFHQDSVATKSLGGVHSEDSNITYIIRIIPNTDTTIYDTIVDSQLPWFVLDTVFNDSVANYIYITNNEAGCDSTIHYFLHIFWNGDHCDTNLTYPNVVTSNNDGINDRFVIGGLLENNCFKFNELIIYDRSGRQVYRTQNIYDESQWWDPKAERCSDGTYFYVFRAHGVSIHTFHKGVIEVLSEEP